MVVGLIRSRLKTEGRENAIEVVSAGTQALEGNRASEYTIELLAEHGIAMSQHAAHQLELPDIDQAHLIIVMEENHRNSIFHQSPANLHKVVLLSELANQHEDIFDPYGHPKSVYIKVMRQIQSYLELGWSRLLEKLEV